jgi:copper chaperone CopZ
MNEAIFTVKGIHCQSCVANIKEAVTELDGVAQVDVDVPGEKVTVRGAVDDGAVREAIASAGYEAV